MADAEKLLQHGFPPIFDKDSRILILGSFPSAISREEGFYYGNPRNRFWGVMSRVFDSPCPKDTQGRIRFCFEHHLALYDTLECCRVKGSSDASIKDCIYADLSPIFKAANIKKVLCNGKAAGRFYKLGQNGKWSVPFEVLPSTSPANATVSFDDLIKVYKAAII